MCGEKQSAKAKANRQENGTYLRGKIGVGTNDLSPKEATEMSRDNKYIGMDVHQKRW